MSAPTPTLLTFRDALVTRLQGITTANGYNFSPRIEANDTGGLDVRALPAVVVGPTRIVEIVPGHAKGTHATGEIEVLCRVRKIADAAGALSDAIKLGDDVLRIIMAAPTAWTIGGGVGPAYCVAMETVPELEDARDTVDVLVTVRASLMPLF